MVTYLVHHSKINITTGLDFWQPVFNCAREYILKISEKIEHFFCKTVKVVFCTAVSIIWRLLSI